MAGSDSYDVVVVGGGPVGLATAVAVADRGRSVAVLEAHGFFGGHGSSCGVERQWRHQYVERDIAELTVTARGVWREFEARVRRRLIHETGSLWFGDPRLHISEGQIDAAAAVLEELSLPYEAVDAAGLRDCFGFGGLPADYVGIHQPQGGVIDVPGTRGALYALAAELGCVLRAHEPVRAIELDGTVRLRTDRGEIRASRVVVAAGAWAGELLRPLGLAVEIATLSLDLTYFRRATAARDYPTWFEFRPPTAGDDFLSYGFGVAPWADDDLVQVSGFSESSGAAGPKAVADSRARTTAWVREHLTDLVPEIVVTGSCLAALPADQARQFYLGSAAGLVPHGDRLVVCAGGWAFKFVPLFGRACADLALDGHSRYALDRFALVPDPNTLIPTGAEQQ
jgi:sarcosine oxidase